MRVLRRDAVTARPDLEHGTEPRSQRLARALKSSTGGEARLMAAVGALEQGAVALGPDARAGAVIAGRLAAPTRLELRRGLGKIPPQIVLVGSRSRLYRN